MTILLPPIQTIPTIRKTRTLILLMTILNLFSVDNCQTISTISQCSWAHPLQCPEHYSWTQDGMNMYIFRNW